MVEFIEVLNTAVCYMAGMVFLVAILFYRKYSHTALRYLPFVLGYVFVLEISAVKIFEILGFNALFYNIYNLGFFMFFYYAFYHFLKKRSNRMLVKMSMIMFISISVFNLFLKSFITDSQLVSYIAGACLLIFCVILYFIEVLYSSRILVVQQQLLFWLSIGVLLFYAGYIPIKITRLYFADKLNVYPMLQMVHLLLILVMNTCFIIGLLWKVKK